MTEVQEDSKQYQWKKGDNFGEVVDFLSEDDKFINFTNGERIFKNILSEFMEPVINGVLPFPTPMGVGSKPAAERRVTNSKTTTPVVDTKEPSIMGKMIMKMSKKNVVSVPITINLNIPTPQLHSILAGGMEDEDLNDEISEVAFSQIEVQKLQEYIKENISTFLKEYYQ